MNESAFPWSVDDGQKIVGNKGMTLRDYFAAKAPLPDDIWKSNYARERGYRGEAKMLADWNYEYADAMLKARRQ